MIPDSVKIVEVGPRDGLQNEKISIPSKTKIDFIKKLRGSGVEDIEITSFVRSDRIPQLSDSEQVFSHIAKDPKFDLTKCSVLIPNEKGLERAKDLGVKRVALFTATSNEFNFKNINSSTKDSLKKISVVARECLAENITVRGYVSTVFGCPYEGKRPSGNLENIIKTFLDNGADEISLGDTIGVGTPEDVERVLDEVLKYCPVEKIAMHFHDTYSRALSNVYSSLKYGVTTFDSSAAGMGGCPYARGASGNLATEDLISFLDALEVSHGLDLKSVVLASGKVLDVLNKQSLSKVHQVVKNEM